MKAQYEHFCSWSIIARSYLGPNQDAARISPLEVFNAIQGWNWKFQQRHCNGRKCNSWVTNCQVIAVSISFPCCGLQWQDGEKMVCRCQLECLPYPVATTATFHLFQPRLWRYGKGVNVSTKTFCLTKMISRNTQKHLELASKCFQLM